MAELKSQIMTSVDADPSVRTDIRVSGGRTRRKVGLFTTDGAQGNGDTLRMFRVRSGDLIHDIKLSCEAISGLTSVDIGLYSINEGAGVDDDLFASAKTLAVALDRFSVMTAHLPFISKQVWEYVPGSLTEDPHLEYDVVILINTAGSTAAKQIVLEVEYTAGD